MKKTLTLMALLACVGTGPLFATEHWWNGVSINKETNLLEGGYTSYKRSSSIDWNMCWAASAANAIAWWQDRVEENGALIIPEETPRGYDVWENVRLWWQNKGGFPGTAIQHWMTGWEGLYTFENYAQTALESSGIQNGGYYNRLAGANLSSSDYGSSFGANHERYEASPNTDYLYKYQYTMIQTYRFLSSNAESPDKTLYQSASERIIQYMDDDYAVLFSTPSHAMTVYGVNANEEGLIDKFYISDNNDIGAAKGKYRELSIFPSDGSSANGPGLMDSNYWGNSHTIRDICVLRTNGIRFLDYDVRVGNNFEGEDEFLFSHYCNLIVDGAQDYELKYDLRDAKAPGSPVDALRVKLATDDDWLSSYEVFTDEEVPTGDLLLRGGKVTLVNCADGREKLDGGGKVAGVIRFQDSVVKGTTDTIQEANRTLKVDRTDTIAKEINLSATKGTNTLEVTEDNVATFGKLTGTGNLAKIGTGTAEVTEEVSLKGSIDVQQGKFVLGVNATLSADTVLTVAKDAQMASTADKPVTLSITSGVHINDGEMTLTTTISESATLKGSGRFGKVTVDGGTLIVGNSPGRQEFEDSLTLQSGRVVFSVAGFNEAASLTSTGGWDSGTYSTIDMNGHEFIVAPDGQIIIALSREAANSLTMAGGDFAMELVSGMSNTLTDEQLAALAKQTTFQLSEELAAQTGRATLATPDYFAYQMVGNKLMLTSGAGDNQTVPEPATSTLSLLALAGLMARRRRK